MAVRPLIVRKKSRRCMLPATPASAISSPRSAAAIPQFVSRYCPSVLISRSGLWGLALADDSRADPPDRLRRALAGREDTDRFWILPESEGRQVPTLSVDIIASS